MPNASLEHKPASTDSQKHSQPPRHRDSVTDKQSSPSKAHRMHIPSNPPARQGKQHKNNAKRGRAPHRSMDPGSKRTFSAEDADALCAEIAALVAIKNSGLEGSARGVSLGRRVLALGRRARVGCITARLTATPRGRMHL
jgi:hypothetical protein